MTRTDRLLLANAIIGQFLSGFASRIFAVSLPTIAADLHADIVGIAWAIIAYQLAGISLSVVFGRLGDIHGRHAIYGMGFGVMSVSAVLCGLAPTVALLILFRLVQGVGAAMIASVARVLAMEAMPEGFEGKANGFMTMSFHSGLLLGPPVGGLVIDLVSWRWVFFLLGPISLAGVVLTLLRVRSRPRRPPTRPAPIDYTGAALLVVITAALTLLLDRRGIAAASLGGTGLMACALALGLVGFVAHERRVANPIVNLALFRIRMFSFSVVSLLLIATTTSVLAFMLPFYIQDVLHFSPSFMGLIFLAGPVFTITFAAVSGDLTDRIGPRIPATLGVAMTMTAFLVGARLEVQSSWTLPAALMALTGLGAGFFNTPNQTAIIASVPREYRGFATGMVQTMFGVGSLLGISLASVLLTVLFRFYSGVPDATPDTGNPAAFVASMNTICLMCAALMLAAGVASFMRGGRRIGDTSPSA